MSPEKFQFISVIKSDDLRARKIAHYTTTLLPEEITVIEIEIENANRLEVHKNKDTQCI